MRRVAGASEHGGGPEQGSHSAVGRRNFDTGRHPTGAAIPRQSGGRD
nr:hypothetical protein [Tanacetum cinerariifolium]